MELKIQLKYQIMKINSIAHGIQNANDTYDQKS